MLLLNKNTISDLRTKVLVLEETLFANVSLFYDSDFLTTFSQAIHELAVLECFFEPKINTECTIDDITGSIVLDNKDLLLQVIQEEFRLN